MSSRGPFPADKAYINDVAVPAPLDSGYRVIEVDGKPAERAQSAVHPVVPFVLVSGGEHTLGLEPKSEVTAQSEAGKRYRLMREGDILSVIEDEK